MKEGIAPSPDKIHSEFIIPLVDEKIRWITVIFNSVYKSGIIPMDWIKSVLIALSSISLIT